MKLREEKKKMKTTIQKRSFSFTYFCQSINYTILSVIMFAYVVKKRRKEFSLYLHIYWRERERVCERERLERKEKEIFLSHVFFV